MKMSPGCCYMLLLLLVFIAVVSGVEDKKEKVGSEARFKSDKTALKDVSITWKYTRGADVIKVIEWDNDFKTEEILNPKFKNRVVLNRDNGELTISNLNLDDTGLYSIEINNKEEKRISLTVKEGVPTPTLKHEETRGDPDFIYLNCDYKTLINWTCSEGKNPVFLNPSKGEQGESITVSRTKNLGVCCNCTLYNEVSQETSNTLCVKDLFTDSGNNIGTVLGILLTFLILLGLILIILLYLCVESINQSIYYLCEGKPCFGGIVTSLDKFSKFKHETNPPGNVNVQPLQPPTPTTSDEGGPTEKLK